MERISQCIGRFVAWQLITEILELFQLFPNVLDRVLEVIIIVIIVVSGGSGGFRGAGYFLADVLLRGGRVRVRLAGDARVIRLESHVLRVRRSCALLKPRVRLLNVRFVRIV